MTDASDPAPEQATTEPTDPPARGSHRRAVWSTILASQLVLALLTAGGVFLVHRNLNDNIEEGKPIDHAVEKATPPGVDADAPKRELNILVMGSDSRVGAGNDIDGENADGSQRSDTVILLHVSQDRTNAYGVSLPRDAIIDRPDCKVDGRKVAGEDGVRFNTAFSVGGAQCTVHTVEKLTGVFIDHFLVLDFEGFKDMVDAVNGVEVCIPKEVDDDEHNIHFDAGTQKLSGNQALNYVRERYQLSVTGDIGRMKRQQAFIASMIKKVRSAGTLSQPKKVLDFLDAVTSSIEVDEDLDSVGKLVDLAMDFRGTGLDKIKFITVPIEPDPNNPEVTLVWSDNADELWERIKNDDKLGKDFSAGSIGADDDLGTEGTEDDEPSEDPSVGSGGNGGGADTQERLAAGLCA
ncbi:LCP family protein [Nocardioides sp.]|uniref:LCP family protein n=1 Tax=Nocardioides sp. TaxID=35761 RepID=UPI00271E9069|nr:LCP family protein [Nocardioides sp.]MDO9454885.1 LCP family protein [Nocardioides sp.]